MENKNYLKRSLVIFFLLGLVLRSKPGLAAGVNLNLNGKIISMPKEMGEPFNEGGRILVPLRFITENLGFTVQWDNDTKEALAKKEGLVVSLPTDGRNPKVNGLEKELDIKPMVKNNRTYVPIRFIAELLSKHVHYSSNDNGKTVFISDNNIYISEKPFSFENKTINIAGRNIKANILTIDTKDSRYRVEMALAHDQDNSVENFQNLIKRKKPMAAINGFFFDSYSGSNTTYGHLVENFKVLNLEGFQPAYYVDKDGLSHIGNPGDRDLGFEDVKHMVSLGPHLVKDSIDLSTQGVDMTTGKGLSRAQRTALGMTPDGKLKIVTANGLTNPDMAKLMIQIGCSDAGNLDGGASSALYYNGKTITRPGRNLNNFVLFYLD